MGYLDQFKALEDNQSLPIQILTDSNNPSRALISDQVRNVLWYVPFFAFLLNACHHMMFPKVLKTMNFKDNQKVWSCFKSKGKISSLSQWSRKLLLIFLKSHRSQAGKVRKLRKYQRKSHQPCSDIKTGDLLLTPLPPPVIYYDLFVPSP